MIELSALDAKLEAYVESFEQEWTPQSKTNLTSYLPPREDPRFLRVASEVLRVDLELSWAAGSQTSITEYEDFIPELKSNPELRALVAYEEYRQRISYGETISTSEFARARDLEADSWSTVVGHTDVTATGDSFSMLGLPRPGDRWREFEIVREIGKGALSRVFLARQTSLSQRQVVLKFAPKHLLEAEKLAQLQHPNIVPVYSVYEEVEHNVFCMPYLGSTTLSEFQHESSTFSKEEILLSFVIKLTQAIRHAHERGILHNDIKPANILVEQGEPRLLDFNLAAEADDNEIAVRVGGTLPYMAPESLQGLCENRQTSDVRSDVFSLGVVVFEIAAKKRPFPDASGVTESLKLRQSTKSTELPASYTPGFRSILAKCLAISPAARYQSASDLEEDLTRHLQQKPLLHAPNNSVGERFKKFCRRHPRLTSLTSVSALLLSLTVATTVAWLSRERYVDRIEVVSALTNFQEGMDRLVPELSAVGLDAVDAESAVREAETMLTEFDDNWRSRTPYRLLSQRDRLRAETSYSKLAFLTSAAHVWLAGRQSQPQQHLLAAAEWNDVSRHASPRAAYAHELLRERVSSLDDGGLLPNRLTLAQPTSDATADDLQLIALLRHQQGDFAVATQLLERACDKSSRDYSKWFDLASVQADAGAWREAEASLSTCLALQKDVRFAHYLRARVRHEQGKYQPAISDYTKFLDSDPNHPIAMLNRALARKALGQHEQALVDLNHAIQNGHIGPRAFIIRARLHRLNGNGWEARKDERQALSAIPRDELDFIARGVLQMHRNPKQALADFHSALEFNPNSLPARRNIAYVLSEKLDKTAEAIETLDELLQIHPNDPGSVGGRGVLLARKGRFQDAIRDAEQVLSMQGTPTTILQAASVYSLASVENAAYREKALSLLGTALRENAGLEKQIRRDNDLMAIRPTEQFKQLCNAAKRLAESPSSEALRAASEPAPEQSP